MICGHDTGDEDADQVHEDGRVLDESEIEFLLAIGRIEASFWNPRANNAREDLHHSWCGLKSGGYFCNCIGKLAPRSRRY